MNQQVSAWNDNGQNDHVSDASAIYRSSFFPGLGWMLHRRVWKELAPKWPKG
jgi:alpha-1,3-mannosyl-glycoprotein beta-1,2-N-acetylglucosaminyltransferase